MTFRNLVVSTALVLGSLSAPLAFSADIEAGKKKAAMCAACHGVAGISPNDLWPNLAGQKAGYLVKQMKAFKDKSRVDPMMNSMIASLSDEDIKNIAAYYASLK